MLIACVSCQQIASQLQIHPLCLLCANGGELCKYFSFARQQDVKPYEERVLEGHWRRRVFSSYFWFSSLGRFLMNMVFLLWSALQFLQGSIPAELSFFQHLDTAHSAYAWLRQQWHSQDPWTAQACAPGQGSAAPYASSQAPCTHRTLQGWLSGELTSPPLFLITSPEATTPPQSQPEVHYGSERWLLSSWFQMPHAKHLPHTPSEYWGVAPLCGGKISIKSHHQGASAPSPPCSAQGHVLSGVI